MPTDEKDAEPNTRQNEPQVEDVKTPEPEEKEPEPKPAVAPEPEPEEEPDSSATTGEKNALKSAQRYLSFTAFSHDGLVSQLEYEQYSHEEAVYAADNCGVDWKE